MERKRKRIHFLKEMNQTYTYQYHIVFLEGETQNCKSALNCARILENIQIGRGTGCCVRGRGNKEKGKEQTVLGI